MGRYGCSDDGVVTTNQKGYTGMHDQNSSSTDCSNQEQYCIIQCKLKYDTYIICILICMFILRVHSSSHSFHAIEVEEIVVYNRCFCESQFRKFLLYIYLIGSFVCTKKYFNKAITKRVILPLYSRITSLLCTMENNLNSHLNGNLS